MADTTNEKKGRSLERISRRNKRFLLRSALTVMKEEGVITGDADSLFKRQVESDQFGNMYSEMRLVEPSYNFSTLYQIYEGSDVLQSCVDAMVQNIDGFGYKLIFLGDDVKDKETPEAARQKTRLEDFFDYANDEQSWTSVSKLVREDIEVLGCGAYEMIRNKRGELMLVYHLPMKNLRICSLSGRAVTVPVMIRRDGVFVKVKVKRYFRRFVQIDATGKRVRWFKTYGDPRTLDALTGEYTESPKLKASEIWFHKHPFGDELYGLPRWIGAILQAMGRRSAAYVNYDLFENQGIPPMAVMVSNGVLSDESIEELEDMIRSMRGVQQWNRIMLLETSVEGVGLEDKGNAKLELKNLTDFRKEDMMFDRYMTSSEKDVRHRYRLPPLYTGQAETFTHATAKAAQTVAEEQVFIPERGSKDEQYNMVLVKQELKVDLWKYASKGPRIVGSAEISKGVELFSKVGAVSINHAIDRANEAFGLEMSKFKEKWADYPLPIVVELLKLGRLKEIDVLADKVKDNTSLLPAPKAQQLLLPGATEKALKNELFSDGEIALYKLLSGLQSALETASKSQHDEDL